MPAAVLQYVFKPNPGVNLQDVVAIAKEGAEFWRKHGGDVSLWAVQVGEVGNMTFVARAESTAKLGATLDALNNDSGFAAWRAKSLKAGLSTWVRSNQAYEIPI
jgi:hypothetical protein